MDDSKEQKAALSAISKCEKLIVDKCKDEPDILQLLFDLGVITEEEQDDANDREEYSSVLSRFKDKVKDDSTVFLNFCSKLGKNCEDVKDLVRSLQDCYNEEVSGEVTDSDWDIDDHKSNTQPSTQPDTTLNKEKYDKLKKQLQTLKDIPTDTEDGHASKQFMIQTAVKSFICTMLDLGTPPHDIHKFLVEVYGTYYLLEKSTYEWCIAELNNQNKIYNTDVIAQPDDVKHKPNELEFETSHIQNALVACHMLEEHKDRQVFPHSLCEVNFSKALIIQTKERELPPHQGLIHDGSSSARTESSINIEDSATTLSPAFAEPGASASTAGALVHYYLIAKHEENTRASKHDVYYIAFSSHQDLVEWKDGYSSFQEGYKKQCQHLPFRFIQEKLWEGNSVVLTGFSFGGILAQLCASHLWTLGQDICPELLERNLLCITFGQPLILLPEMERAADRIAEHRFHAIFAADDIVPRMMRYLDTSYSTCVAQMDMPERFLLHHSSNKMTLFQDEVSVSLIDNLIPLQSCTEKFSRTQIMRHKLKRKINEGAVKLSAAKTGIRSVVQGRPLGMPMGMQLGGTPLSMHSIHDTMKHKIGEVSTYSKPTVLDSLASLHTLAVPPRHKIKCISSYIECHKIGARGHIECKDIDLKFPSKEDFGVDLFSKHNTEGYINLMFQGRTQLETVIPKQSDFTKPCVKRIEVHHFSHRQTASISIDGENLYFTYHCKLQMKYNDSKSELSFRVDNQKAISNQSIQLQNQQIDIPPDILDSSNSTGDNEYQEFCGSATVTLQTHFQEEIIFSDIPVKHKKFTVSCRKQQMAKLTPTDIIELCFLSALLEKPPEGSQAASNRYLLICEFFKLIEMVVPIESAFSCVANVDECLARRICLTLRNANLSIPFSLSLFINTALAVTKLQGGSRSVSMDDQSLTLEDLFYVFTVAARKFAATKHKVKSVGSRLMGQQSVPLVDVEGKYMEDYLKWFDPTISAASRNSDLVSFLQSMMADTINKSERKITAISGISATSLFNSTKNMNENLTFAPVIPPTDLLQCGRKWLQELQKETRQDLMNQVGDQQGTSTTGAYNARLLKYVNSLRSNDLYICVRILLSFMEETVRIPVSEVNPKISYWKLLKLGLGIIKRKFKTKGGISQYISVSKHVKNIADEVSCQVTHFHKEGITSEAEQDKYAGKLQFLLSASLCEDDAMLIDEEYPIYSMEKQLSDICSDRSITSDTPHYDIWKDWDTYFKDLAIGTVIESHRQLIARWLRFSLTIHKIRNKLSCHTTIGIVGLVNSGKSTLVHSLFKIKVETGTREEKRTTVPFLYNIQGVEYFDVIDFPGVDDQDESISDLVDLLRSLSQLVVFVVNYRNAHTQAAVQWYKKLNEHSIPHLVCLTHGDRLYAECREEQEEHGDPSYTKRIIKLQSEIITKKINDKVCESPVRSVGMYSLRVDADSDLNSEEGQEMISEAGIMGVKEVGKWIIFTLEEHLKEAAIANKLKEHFQYKKD